MIDLFVFVFFILNVFIVVSNQDLAILTATFIIITTFIISNIFILPDTFIDLHLINQIEYYHSKTILDKKYHNNYLHLMV